jgi:hypothetical protein
MKDMLLKTKGVWVVTLEDKSKWVIDLDNNMFDSYKWYRAEGTLESELNNIDEFLKGSWKKLK